MKGAVGTTQTAAPPTTTTAPLPTETTPAPAPEVTWVSGLGQNNQATGVLPPGAVE